MPTKPKILFFAPTSSSQTDWISNLRENGISFEPVLWRAGVQSGAELAIVRRPPDELFRTETCIRTVFVMAAGVDQLLALPSIGKDTQIVRLIDVGMAAQISEYVIHALAQISREMDHYARSAAQAVWRPLRFDSRQNWPVGIMGTGAIGRKVAELLALLEYPVYTWSRSGADLPNAITYSGSDGLQEFLENSRVLVNALPLTAETKYILCNETFQHLPTGSYVINVGRGDHIRDKDLLENLRSGHIAGAVLDTFSTEPLPRTHEFWKHPKIRITPHISGTTDDSAAIQQIAQNLRALAEGKPLTGIVDRARGY